MATPMRTSPARRRRWPWLLLLALVLVVLVGWFPARWAWAVLGPRYPAIHADAVHGNVWDGRAEGVAVAAHALGEVRWTLARSALFGELRLAAHIDGPLLDADGQLQRDSDGTLTGDDLHFRLSAAQWPPSALTGGMQPQGEIDGSVRHWRLRQGWPVQLDGTVTWHDAALGAGARTVDLGTFEAELSAVAGTTLKAAMRDTDASPVALHGTVLATPLGWRLDALLTPRGGDPRVRATLLRLGAPDGNGSIRVRRQAGVFAWSTAP